jgi:hypothetical protein
VTDIVGVGMIVTGAALGVLTSFALWRRLAQAPALALAAASGVMVGMGALLVQDSATAADWVVTLILLGTLAPIHSRLVFGTPGEVR